MGLQRFDQEALDLRAAKMDHKEDRDAHMPVYVSIIYQFE
jgi:hypothetical protein